MNTERVRLELGETERKALVEALNSILDGTAGNLRWLEVAGAHGDYAINAVALRRARWRLLSAKRVAPRHEDESRLNCTPACVACGDEWRAERAETERPQRRRR